MPNRPAMHAGRPLLLGLLLVALGAPAAAADRIYWGESSEDVISFANSDGSGGGADVVAPGASLLCPWGTAVDLAAGRLYWSRCGGAGGISFANLDGTGGGNLDTTGATTNDPTGVAFDPASGRVYWANRAGNAISFFPAPGGVGGADLDTTGATVSTPSGVALDVAAGRIYWANETGNPISFAALDGSGGGDLDTTGATAGTPSGLAIDAAAGRVYWTNYGGNTISFAALDGSGGGDLGTDGATVDGPLGIAIDRDGGRIYWANYGGSHVSFARLDGSGGADLDTTGATPPVSSSFPVLVQAPRAVGTATIAGGTEPGAVLSCAATWAPDVIGAFLYRVPTTVTHQWSRDGVDVPGATDTSYEAFVPGTYRCAVTGGNVAGATVQISEPHAVAAPPVPPTECTVPNVVGQALSVATATLEANGCALGKVKRRRVDAGRADIVLRQKPKPGKVLALGATVKLVAGRARRL